MSSVAALLVAGLAALGFLVGPRVVLGSGSPLGEWTDEDRLSGIVHEDFWGFGEAVDISGDLAIVGAPKALIEGDTNRGAAYIFRRQGTSWIQEAMLLASDGEAMDGFGWSVAIEGGMAIVGAPFDNEGTESNRGAIYVFEAGGPWVEVGKLHSSEGDEQDLFGFSLALDGDELVVGAPEAGPANEDRGAAYVFAHDGDSWNEVQKLDAGLGTFGTFGFSTTIEGPTLAIGDINYGVVAAGGGAVYIFVQDAGIWIQQQKLEASDAGTIDMLGSDVALDGDTLLAGAEQKIIGENVRQGAAYVFTRSGGVWTEQVRLTASNGHEDTNFGKAVALDGNLALVGAELDTNGQNNQGVVYEYRFRDGAWEEIQWFTAPIGQGLDNFGEALDLDGERLIVGNSDNIMVEPHGTAWIFLRPLLLFCDDFESGDTSSWSTTVP